jgi:hypothetical protein
MAALTPRVTKVFARFFQKALLTFLLLLWGNSSFESSRLSLLKRSMSEEIWRFAPSLIVGSREMFFVRVNRFWCVWMRELVLKKTGPKIW